MNNAFLVYQAKSFYNAYIALEQIKNAEDPLMYYVPMLVNGAFASELALKAILSEFNIEYKKEHNLKVLFDLFPTRLKDLFWKYLAYKKPEYADEEKRETELIIMSDAFVKWRYSFEGNNAPAFDTGFLSAFANAAIFTMFGLGFDASYRQVELTETIEEIERKYEENRNLNYQKNLRYINSKEGCDQS